MKLVIDLQKITLNDLIALEDGANYRTLRQIISRFVTDDAGKSVSAEDAEQFAGSLALADLKNVNEQIKDAIGGAVSPEAGGG